MFYDGAPQTLHGVFEHITMCCCDQAIRLMLSHPERIQDAEMYVCVVILKL